MFKTGITLLLLAGMALIGGCSHKEDKMQVQLDGIRLMIKQSALLAVQAACTGPESRQDLILASATLLRRAMGGKEMAAVHKMMGKMSDTPDGSMAKGNGDSMAHQDNTEDTTTMQMHVATHDAGEAVFELLDALGGSNAPTCNQMQAAGLATAAALLREHNSAETDRMQHKLDGRSHALMRPDIPATVQQMTQALTRI